jgi:hypothetical protein
MQIPEDLENVPMVDEALASAAYTSATGGARTPSRKTRWTTEQIEALIEGVEKYGLSAWRTIVMVRERVLVVLPCLVLGALLRVCLLGRVCWVWCGRAVDPAVWGWLLCWTSEQIEALIEGVEKYGLSAWHTIVMVRESACCCCVKCE